MAKELGGKAAILLYGHGAVTVETSLINLVARADSLRQNAIVEQQAILLAGKVDYIKPAPRPSRRISSPAAVSTQGRRGASGADRAWEYWKRLSDSQNKPSTKMLLTVAPPANSSLPITPIRVLIAEDHFIKRRVGD